MIVSALGNEYILELPSGGSRNYLIWCYGADGVQGGEGETGFEGLPVPVGQDVVNAVEATVRGAFEYRCAEFAGSRDGSQVAVRNRIVVGAEHDRGIGTGRRSQLANDVVEFGLISGHRFDED